MTLPSRALQPAPLLAPLGPLAPMAKVRRVPLVEREVKERLGAAALDLLLSRASVLAEGQRGTTGGRETYFGTVLFTIDVTALAAELRAGDATSAARRTAELMARDPRVDRRLRARALGEVEGRLGRPLAEAQLEVRVHASAGRVHADVDLSGVLR